MDNNNSQTPGPAILTPSKTSQMHLETENSEKISKMELENTPQNMNPPSVSRESFGKQSPAKFVKSYPNKQEFSGFNQPEEHITIIFSSFKDSIRNADVNRLREILRNFISISKNFLKIYIFLYS